MRPVLIALGVGCGGLVLLLFFFVACAVVLGSVAPEEDQQANAPEQTAEPEQTVESAPVEDAPLLEETTEARPSTPKERIEANVRETFAGREDSIESLSVNTNDTANCYDVYVAFEEPSPLFDTMAGSIESQMERVYTAVYSEDDLRRLVCGAETHASGVLTDNRGNESKETLYSTFMHGDTADTVNWGNVSAVDFASVWTVEYVHPVLERERAESELGQAVDCADDGGVLDFDFLECP